MDLSDYLRTLRQQWPVLLASLAVCVALASAYLLITPKQYAATASVLLIASNPGSITDAAQGVQLANSAAGTVADVIGSSAVLATAAADGPAGLTTDDYLGAVAAAPRNGGGVIDIIVTADDGPRAADMANATARAAEQLVPGLEGATPAAAPIRLRPIQQAVPPGSPTSPNTRGVLVVGIAIGLALGLGLAIARQALDTRLRRPEDLGRVTESRLLAVVPHLNRAQRRLTARNGIIVQEEPAGAVGDAFRTLRTNIGNLDLARNRTFLIAPAQEDHLGPFVALNLAWSIAQSGREVLIIDLDLRHPKVNEALRRPASPGLGDLLSASGPLAGVIQSTDNPRLHLIAAGDPQDSPSDLLSTPRMGRVFDELEDQFDYIVLNAPAISDYTDAAVVARFAGWTLVTVSASVTRTEVLDAALTTLRSANVDSIGLVLTGASDARGTNRRLRAGRELTAGD